MDGDGLVDLAVANDTVPNFFFHNRGAGRFEEIGLASGLAVDSRGEARGGMGIDWADFKDDGTLGLAIGNFANEMTALYVSDDPASLQFTDQANVHGLGAATLLPLKFGLFFFDYDLDGRLDLLQTNGHLERDIARVQGAMTYAQAPQLFRNTGRSGRERFTRVGPETAGPDLFRPIVGRGSSYADIDGDGDLDILLTTNGGAARLFRNDRERDKGNHWVRFVLSGDPSNRDAIGARVTVKAGSASRRRQLFPARGYLSSVEFPMTFGLGASDQVDSVEIHWPSGRSTVLGRLPADHVYRVGESKGWKSLQNGGKSQRLGPDSPGFPALAFLQCRRPPCSRTSYVIIPFQRGGCGDFPVSLLDRPGRPRHIAQAVRRRASFEMSSFYEWQPWSDLRMGLGRLGTVGVSIPR